MNGIEGRGFVLQCNVQGIMFLLLGYIYRHAPILHRPAFRVPGQYTHAAVPANRAVLPAKSELMARCTHDCFIKSTGIHIAEEIIPVFRVNAAREGFKFIWKITLVTITHQPTEAIAPMHR